MSSYNSLGRSLPKPGGESEAVDGDVFVVRKITRVDNQTLCECLIIPGVSDELKISRPDEGGVS